MTDFQKTYELTIGIASFVLKLAQTGDARSGSFYVYWHAPSFSALFSWWLVWRIWRMLK